MSAACNSFARGWNNPSTSATNEQISPATIDSKSANATRMSCRMRWIASISSSRSAELPLFDSTSTLP
ncbi:hypothetical protein [Sporisorium scitamineum]|uniref:Uncharacterized protein n=1 Tax=Sporisorium scitamineum TaxID=49012 RepID=A0A0F7S6X2_9BASI|nr:hypothetical protein [Sporisorium scitamineum]